MIGESLESLSLIVILTKLAQTFHLALGKSPSTQNFTIFLAVHVILLNSLKTATKA
jgi:hypothetical protein